jgi:hypothetical protein
MTSRHRSIYLPNETFERLEALGKSLDRSINWLIRDAVEKYLVAQEGNGTRNLRRIYEAYGGNPVEFDSILAAGRIVPSNIHNAAAAETILVPETLGPDIRTTGEPVLPAAKRVEVSLPDARWGHLPKWETQHAVTDTHRGITYCGRQTSMLGGVAPALGPTPPVACHDCRQAIAKAVREGRL